MTNAGTDAELEARAREYLGARDELVAQRAQARSAGEPERATAIDSQVRQLDRTYHDTLARSEDREIDRGADGFDRARFDESLELALDQLAFPLPEVDDEDREVGS